jgi:pyrroloquinoline quinone biosynthesis protein D
MRDARPRLASKARLRWDKRESKYLLVYPERGILLNATAGAILAKCDGLRTVDVIVSELCKESEKGSDAATIRADVTTFLEEMRKRGVLEMTP